MATPSSTNSDISTTQMAIISSVNRTCASESLLELYRSYKYILSTSFNIIIPIISLFFLVYAIKQLCAQSIIQYSTRVLLITTILFAVCHQIAYFCFKADLLYTMLFKLDQPCNLQHSSYDCRFITIATTTSNCGMALVQLAMSIDRVFALKFNRVYYKLKSIPGITLALITLSISFSMFFILTIDDPLSGYVNHCGFYPTYSQDKFHIFLDVTLYLAVFNFVFDIGLMYYSYQEILWKRSYSFVNRFQSRISLKCTQAIFIISICQCISNVLYSGLLSLLMKLGRYMSSADYNLSLSLAYTTPYSCLILPILICKVLEYIKKQRTVGILSLRNQKQSMEGHMAMINSAWK